VYKTLASDEQLSNCILLPAYLRTAAAPNCIHDHKQKLHVAYYEAT